MLSAFTSEKLEFLRHLLSYEPDTGLFRWKVDTRTTGRVIRAGETAGHMSGGYIVIGVLGIQHRANILAYWFMTGAPVPKGFEIDHDNRIKTDNRWTNLKPVTRSRNNHNSEPPKTNKSGVKGVSWCRGRNRWDSRIRVDDKIILLGRFANFQDAVKARLDAEVKYLGTVYSVKGGAPTAPQIAPVLTLKRKVSAEQRKTLNRESSRKKSLTVRRTNTSGCPGVRLHKTSGLWHARITVDRKEHSLGYFKTFDEAAASRRDAELKFHQQTS
jgi:hypothetical protein